MYQNGNFNNRASSQTMKTLPANRMMALRDLHINPTHVKERDESPIFLLYLNYAVNNICRVAELDENLCEENKVGYQLRKKNSDILRKLANFFWLFKADDPERDFKDYERYAIEIAMKIYALRNYFAHLNQSGVEPLVVSRDLYVLLEGILATEALGHCLGVGKQSSKLFKMHLFAKHDRMGNFEFTRKGLVFLICLALYRDDAVEFTQCLEDMKLPSCPKTGEATCDCSEICTEEEFAACKPRVARTLVDFFTFFSARRGRSVNALAENADYLAFADISCDLNKVPAPSMEYLTLDGENEKLRKLAENSTESEENKRFKYTLHKRFKDRFLSFAAGYVEDFDRIPCMNFKRLDISESVGRKRYFFGKDNDNRVRMDRHFIVRNNAIHFEWKARKHYGKIHIDSLRSAISASAMKELLFADFNFYSEETSDMTRRDRVNNAVNGYFEAYHRILETMLNAIPETLHLDYEELRQNFSIVSGIPQKHLTDDLSPLYRFFPKSLIRYLTEDSEMKSIKDLREELDSKIRRNWNRAVDFLTRQQKLEDWRRKLRKLREKDSEAKLPRPICTVEEVENPPRNCDISDGDMIAWVFRYFNIFLDDKQKFRQLPLGEQHRDGIVDHEYQIVHSLIGKYSLDPKGLPSYIENRRPELSPAWNQINSRLKKILAEKKKYLLHSGSAYDDKGRPKRVMADLRMLSVAAAFCYIDYCSARLDELERGLPDDQILKLCKKFGVKQDMPCDMNSMYKTILRIDLANWLKAYNAETGANFENRSLDQIGHIVPQVPFPNDFCRRILLKVKDDNLRQYAHFESGVKPFFDINKAFNEMQLDILPRDYYDTTPLINALKAGKAHQPVSSVRGIKMVSEPDGFPVDLSTSALRKAISTIKEICNQDKILLKIAKAYWEKFRVSSAFGCEKKNSAGLSSTPSIYDFFDAAVTIPFDDDKTKSVRIMPNDINRPILSQIIKLAPFLAKRMPSVDENVFEFYEMLKIYRKIQSADRRKRLEIIPYLAAFESKVQIPSGNYDGKSRDEIRAMEFQYFSSIFKELTREDYNKIADCRNAVLHREIIDLDVDNVVSLLKRMVELPKAPVSNTHNYGGWNRGRF